MIDLDTTQQKPGPVAKIKVIGVGGAGSNTVNSIIDSGCQSIEFFVANTDLQALECSRAPHKIQIGIKSTKGLGTGANPELGKRSAEEDLDKIMHELEDADIVFLAAGMGGGTGSGAVPVIARALRERGILTIAIVTKPFVFEGKRRTLVAAQAIEKLAQEVDTLIVIPNQKLLEVVDYNVSMIDAFAMINELLSQSLRGISDIITRPGHINLDFADVCTIMRGMGLAVMGTGKASGADRAQKATLHAISSPLLENMSIEGAHGVLLNITGGKNLGIHEISEAASMVYERAAQDANIIIGSVIDESLTDEVIVTIIATGFEQQPLKDQSPKVHRVASVQFDAIETKEAPIEAKTVPEVVAEPIELSLNQHEEKKAVKNDSSPLVSALDMNDLDIPTYLREEHSQEDKNI